MPLPAAQPLGVEVIGRADDAEGVKYVRFPSLLLPSRCVPAAIVLVATISTVGTLGGIAYCTASNLDPELMFLEPNRAPTIDEAMVSCPAEYALRSTEKNDVIFLGGSSCRCGINPALLPGLNSYNLGSIVGLAPDGIYLTCKAYLDNHPRPQVVVLCLSPITFDWNADDTWASALTRRFIDSYGSRAGMPQPFGQCSERFVKRGFNEIVNRARRDLRDLPLTGEEANTYRRFSAAFLGRRGYIAMPGDHPKGQVSP